MHLTMLGVIVKDDGGYLFALAVIVLACNLFALHVNKNKILTVFRSHVKVS
jgi:hypothetical protein